MKKNYIVLLLVLITSYSFGETSENLLGIQLSSTTNAEAVLRLHRLELGLGAQAFLGDGISADQGVLNPHIYLSYRFYSENKPFTFTTGVEVGTGLGLDELEYDEYTDLSLRLGFDYSLDKHFRVSGLLYPIRVTSTEISGVEDSWDFQVLIPRAAVAVAYFF